MSQIARDRDTAAQFGVKYALEPFGASLNSVDPDIIGADDAEV